MVSLRQRRAALMAVVGVAVVGAALALASCGGGSEETTPSVQAILLKPVTPSKLARADAAVLTRGLSGEERAVALAAGFYLGAYEGGDLLDVCRLTSPSSSLFSGCKNLNVPYPRSPLLPFARDRIAVQGEHARLHLIFPKRPDLDLTMTLERGPGGWKVLTARYRISRLPKNG